MHALINFPTHSEAPEESKHNQDHVRLVSLKHITIIKHTQAVSNWSHQSVLYHRHSLGQCDLSVICLFEAHHSWRVRTGLSRRFMNSVKLGTED